MDVWRKAGGRLSSILIGCWLSSVQPTSCGWRATSRSMAVYGGMYLMVILSSDWEQAAHLADMRQWTRCKRFDAITWVMLEGGLLVLELASSIGPSFHCIDCLQIDQPTAQAQITFRPFHQLCLFQNFINIAPPAAFLYVGPTDRSWIANDLSAQTTFVLGAVASRIDSQFHCAF